MAFVSQNDLEFISHVVADTFNTRRASLQSKLSEYQLDVYFLTDFERRGCGTIRAYIESFNFEKFTPETRQTGGKFFAFCDLFTVRNFI